MSKLNKRASKRPARTILEPKKESVFNELSSILGAAGYVVRREKLKAGPGWRVVSGMCRKDDNKLIFVDRRMTQDDQILFLASRISALKVHFPKDKVSSIPENVLKKCGLGC